MIDILTQIGQTPPTTAFMLGFSMALALRRGRVEQIMDGAFGGLSGSTDSEDSTDDEDSESSKAVEWEKKQLEQ